MNGKKAFRKFCEHLMSAPADALFRVGLTWEPGRGWCVFESIGDAVLVLSPKQARSLVVTARRQSQSPEFQKGWQEVRDSFELMAKLADECDEKNRDGVIPDPILAAAPPSGFA